MEREHEFTQQISIITDFIGQQRLDAALQTSLNQHFPAQGEVVQSIYRRCLQAIEAGWMCQHSHGGIDYGRVVQPCPELQGFSVDVVNMEDVQGPHHSHPHGEIDLIMPVDNGALFDGHPGGWLVYGPESAHRPTVTEGRALVLYLLPQGAIEFTRQAR